MDSDVESGDTSSVAVTVLEIHRKDTDGNEFIPTSQYDGPRYGKVFRKNGKSGSGYYAQCGTNRGCADYRATG